jgi:hypothetical protein
MDVFDQIATGVRPPPLPSVFASQAGPSLHEQQLSYALAKQVPDMARGFTIHTNYGDLTIPPGWMAERIQSHAEHVLRAELKAIQEGAA